MPITITQDAFDSKEIWLTSPELAFTSWTNGKRYKDSSKKVVMSMFGKLMRWLRARDIQLVHCDSAHLKDFLDEERLTKQHRHRYVRLLERVFDHLLSLGILNEQSHNPGRIAAKRKVGRGHNDPTQFLSRQERTLVMRAIGKEIPVEQRLDRWQEIRDRALVAVVLGGGVKVGQVKWMTVNCIDVAVGWVEKRSGGFGGEKHRARLAPWALSALLRWLDVRAQLDLPGNALFPGGAVGPRRPPGAPMHAVSVFRRVHAFLADVGVSLELGLAMARREGPSDIVIEEAAGAARLCAQTLRNTYAASLFEEGAVDELVLEYLGLKSLASAQRLRAAWNIAKHGAADDAGEDAPAASSGEEEIAHFPNLPTAWPTHANRGTALPMGR